MHATEPVQRVRIYVSERDTVGGQPLYMAALELLRGAGATGATAVRGIAGFGASQHLRLDQAGLSRSLPIVIEWIDRAERIARILPSMDNLLPNALITIEDVRVYRATLRSSGPFGERTLASAAKREVAVAGSDIPLAAAVQVLLEHEQPVLPVLDEGEQVVGVFGAADLPRRGLPTLPELRALAPEALADQLSQLGDTALGAGLPSDQRVLSGDASILQAASTMIEWGLDVLPVVGRDGRFLGLFGIAEVLQAALDARQPQDGPVRSAEPPTPISLLMQGAIQSVIAHAPATSALERLRSAPDQPLIVVDNNRPFGVLTSEELLLRLEEPYRAAWVGALRGGWTSTQLEAAFGEMRVASLPRIELPAAPATATRDEAIELLLSQNRERLAVVDESGKLIGLLGRRTILRALVQESTG